MITAILISLVVGFIAGALVFRKHASRAAQLEAKSRTILDVLKGR
jgi:hypothetical protein